MPLNLTRRFANPGAFSASDPPRWLLPLCAGASLTLFIAGLYYALFASPPDYQQGETVRIMYLHVPAAWVSLLLYVAVMAVAAATGLVARHALADVFCAAAAPVGAVLVALCLITGSIWGKPSWGAWWVWDARLTSVLILFLLYLGYIVLRQSFADHERGGTAGAILLLVGAVNIPIIRFSVDWWHTLHQPASVLKLSGPSIAPEMMRPLFIMAGAYAFYVAALIMLRMQAELLKRRIEAQAAIQSS